MRFPPAKSRIRSSTWPAPSVLARWWFQSAIKAPSGRPRPSHGRGLLRTPWPHPARELVQIASAHLRPHLRSRHGPSAASPGCAGRRQSHRLEARVSAKLSRRIVVTAVERDQGSERYPRSPFAARPRAIWGLLGKGSMLSRHPDVTAVTTLRAGLGSKGAITDRARSRFAHSQIPPTKGQGFRRVDIAGQVMPVPVTSLAPFRAKLAGTARRSPAEPPVSF